MKVVLLKDVAGLGKKNEVREVKSGHASNFLIPRGLAEVATEASMRRGREELEKKRAEKLFEEKLSQEALKKLSGVSITLKKKASPEGHLFGSLRVEELATALEKETGISLASSHIKIKHPIKTLGEQEIPVEIGSQKAKFKLLVVGE